MVVSLSPEREAELLAEYKLRAAKMEAETQRLADQQAKEKAERDAFWEAKRNPAAYPSGSSHICEVCNGSISKGDLIQKCVRYVNLACVGGYSVHPRTFYRHVGCEKTQ